MLTRRAAQAQFWLAYDLVTRLPQVHAAMDTADADHTLTTPSAGPPSSTTSANGADWPPSVGQGVREPFGPIACDRMKIEAGFLDPGPLNWCRY